jgi:hypothetical protein
MRDLQVSILILQLSKLYLKGVHLAYLLFILLQLGDQFLVLILKNFPLFCDFPQLNFHLLSLSLLVLDLSPETLDLGVGLFIFKDCWLKLLIKKRNLSLKLIKARLKEC